MLSFSLLIYGKFGHVTIGMPQFIKTGLGSIKPHFKGINWNRVWQKRLKIFSYRYYI